MIFSEYTHCSSISPYKSGKFEFHKNMKYKFTSYTRFKINKKMWKNVFISSTTIPPFFKNGEKWEVFFVSFVFFFSLSQLFWTLLEHMIFYNRREALVQNALKNIKDGGGREEKSCKEPAKLGGSKSYGYRNYTRIYANVYKYSS